MKLEDILKEKILILDGAMGTMLQAKGLPAGAMAEYMNDYPQTVLDIHMQYINAGADIISSNTFSANGVKMQGKDLFAEVFKGVSIAKQAAAATSVLPQPTSPWTSRFMGSPLLKSARISRIAACWASVRVKGRAAWKGAISKLV